MLSAQPIYHRAGRGHFGPPIVCQHFDLQAALICENTERMAREDRGIRADEEEHELESPTPPSNIPADTSPTDDTTAYFARVKSG
ncbi:hypothetical protein FB45DRAFT_1028982 [Roridomyces roridus]|uniref:Uncharacterized protein n=1 Tax=Roridomyces roridus TaxID=1738132 RepID=A0AAD7BRX9_9AGAR|nr:hypothetical protein FB45DRAFT_1028982 [Roridomyces roridus]